MIKRRSNFEKQTRFLLELSGSFYCAMYDHMYDNGLDLIDNTWDIQTTIYGYGEL